jgi:multiple sugar transport system substrate-binding protein
VCIRGYGFTLLVFLLAITGCRASRATDGDAPGGRITLEYWSATNADELEFARRVASEWNAEHPEVEIRVRPVPSGQSSEEVILAAVASRTTPDIYASVFPGALQDLVDAESVVRLDELPGFTAAVLERMPEELLNQYRSPDGRLYQLPWKSNPIMLMYNTRMLREAGVTELPRTYSEYLEAASRVTRDRDGDGAVDEWMAAIDYVPLWYKRMFDYYPLYLAATGGRTLLEGRRVAFDNEESVAIFRLLQECFSRGYVPRQTAQGDTFLDGRVASRFSGPWSISYLERYAPPGFEYDFGPVLRPDAAAGQPITYADPKSIVIFATCRHPREAWEFVKFVVTKRNDLRLLEGANQLPIRAGLLGDPEFADYFARNPKMERFAEQAIATRTIDAVPELKELLDIIAQEFEASVVFSLKSPEQAVHDAARRSQQVLDVE